MSSSQKLSISSESVEKMGDEVASLLNLFNSFKMAGKSATLVLSTEGGKSTAKLEVNLSKAKSSSSPSTAASAKLLTSPGCQASRDRERPQPSAAKRARANARAAQHRVHLALPFPKGDYSAAVGPPLCSLPPPRRPLCFHPSPTCENRRRIVTVDRTAGFQPTFSQLDGEDGDAPPACQSTRPRPGTFTHPACDHCEGCGKCKFLCTEHSGCDCDVDYQFDCDICHCSRTFRYSNPSWTMTSIAEDFSK